MTFEVWVSENEGTVTVALQSDVTQFREDKIIEEDAFLTDTIEADSTEEAFAILDAKLNTEE
jgi:hypothetical protein